MWFFFSSRRRHTRLQGDWSSDVCSSDLGADGGHGVNLGILANDEELFGGGEFVVGAVFGEIGRGADFEGGRRESGGGFGRLGRSEERRVGKEWRSRWSPYH